MRDHQEIVRLSMRQDFPFDTTRSLELALFRSFCSPSISALLDRTSEFRRAAQKRYDDTDLIVSALVEFGYDSSNGRAALLRMNQIHGRFAIANDDFLYVLSTFIYEPIRWNARFGWRPLSDRERLAYFLFWREVGIRMGIQHIPADYHVFERFSRAYEKDRFQPADTTHRVGVAIREMFASWFRLPRPLIRRVLCAMMDEPMLRALKFDAPPEPLRQVVLVAMRARALLVRMLPRRRTPVLRTLMPHRSYPRGYRIDQLGPR